MTRKSTRNTIEQNIFPLDENIDDGLENMSFNMFPINSVLYRYHGYFLQYWLVMESTEDTYTLGLLKIVQSSLTQVQATLDYLHIFVLKSEEVEEHFQLASPFVNT